MLSIGSILLGALLLFGGARPAAAATPCAGETLVAPSAGDLAVIVGAVTSAVVFVLGRHVSRRLLRSRRERLIDYLSDPRSG